MSTTRDILEGTWEEIARHAGRLAGKWVRLEVLDNGNGPAEAAEARQLPFYATATKAERVRALRAWAASHRRDTPLLSDEAISRESIYLCEE